MRKAERVKVIDEPEISVHVVDEQHPADSRLQEQEKEMQEQEKQRREQASQLQQHERGLLDGQVQALRATLAQQEAHLALLTERNAFLTAREAESRRQLVSAHEQLALRDADYRNLLANYERQRRDLGEVYDELFEAQKQVSHLSAELTDTSHYAEELERSWQEKNAEIARLEQQLAAQSSRSLRSLASRVLGRVLPRGR